MKFLVSSYPTASPGLKAKISPGGPAYNWLTAARGFFITWIMLRHFSYDSGPAGWIPSILPSFRTFDIPTTFFFVLSGMIFSVGKPATLDWPSIRSFWLARLGRLYPLYILVLLILAPIGWNTARGDVNLFLFSGLVDATFQQGWFGPPDYVSWFMVGWFMSTIAFCYFFYPLLAPFFSRLATPWLVVCFAACAFYSWATGLYWENNAENFKQVVQARKFALASLPVFCMGICLGALISRGQRAIAYVAAFLTAAGSLYVLLALTPKGHHLFVAAPIWPLFLMLAFLATKSPYPVLVRYGELGFTLYMIHWPAYMYSRLVLKKIGFEAWISSPLYLLLLLAFLALSARWVHDRFERPAYDWIKKKIGLGRPLSQ